MAKPKDPHLTARLKTLNWHRRMIRIQRRFTVRDLGDGVFEYTCKTCGHVHRKDHQKAQPAGRLSMDALAKLAAYQQQGGGASGICKNCTKKARDERFPLPKKE